MYKVGQNTSRLLLVSGDVVIGWLLLRQAAVAQAKLAEGGTSEKDTAFYQGKVAAARFFSRTVLPTVHAQRLIAEGIDNTIMDLPEAAF
jgi:hypothetical protein